MEVEIPSTFIKCALGCNDCTFLASLTASEAELLLGRFLPDDCKNGCVTGCPCQYHLLDEAVRGASKVQCTCVRNTGNYSCLNLGVQTWYAVRRITDVQSRMQARWNLYHTAMPTVESLKAINLELAVFLQEQGLRVDAVLDVLYAECEAMGLTSLVSKDAVSKAVAAHMARRESANERDWSHLPRPQFLQERIRKFMCLRFAVFHTWEHHNVLPDVLAKYRQVDLALLVAMDYVFLLAMRCYESEEARLESSVQLHGYWKSKDKPVKTVAVADLYTSSASTTDVDGSVSLPIWLPKFMLTE